MKLLKILFMFVLVLNTFSQEDTYFVTEKDEFKGITRNYLHSNELSNPRLAFNLQEVITNDVKVLYIEIDYAAGQNWIFIYDDQVSMILLVDGAKREYKSTKTDQEVKKSAREYAYYEITNDELFFLSQAKEIRIKIYGKKGEFETSFKEINIKRLYTFWDRFIFNK